MRRRWYSMKNMDGYNIILSFVIISSESNVQERGKETYILETRNLC